MTPEEDIRFQENYQWMKKMQAVAIGLLLSIVAGGFGMGYHFHARISVLESHAGEGQRFTMHNFTQFHTEYEERKALVNNRLDKLEKLTVSTVDQLARMDTKLEFIVEALKEQRKRGEQ